jgi:predicted N-acetyltransferase YhbS
MYTTRLRPGTPADAEACGEVCFAAFGAIAAVHGFPSDFPSKEVAIGLMSMLLGHPGWYSVVAERDGRVIGSNFLDVRSSVFGVGPISVDPSVQDNSVGRALMQDVLDLSAQRGAPGVRLVQSGYHNRSFALYAKLGFDAQGTLACMQGPAIGVSLPGREVRPALDADISACNGLSRRVHGHDRSGELHDAISQGAALVVEYDGRITGYSTGIAFFAHTVGETTDDVKALIGSASEFAGPGILVPAENHELLRWCLINGLQVTQLMTLMTLGLYKRPTGAFLPSVLY